MTDEDRAFISEVLTTLRQLAKEAKRRRFSTLSYILLMAVAEAQGKLRE